jgi:hypothetical protein
MGWVEAFPHSELFSLFQKTEQLYSPKERIKKQNSQLQGWVPVWLQLIVELSFLDLLEDQNLPSEKTHIAEDEVISKCWLHPAPWNIA